MRIRPRPLPISAPTSNVSVHRRPPPPPAVYDWSISDWEYTDLPLSSFSSDGTEWLTTELGEPT